MNKITTISIPNNIDDDIGKFFRNKNFIWKNIPTLAVITGLNGSGKSKLLRFIYEKYSLAYHNNNKYNQVDYFEEQNPDFFDNTNLKEDIDVENRCNIRYLTIASSMHNFTKESGIKNYLDNYNDASCVIGDRIEAQTLYEICQSRRLYEENKPEYHKYIGLKKLPKEPWNVINDIFQSFNLSIRFQLDIERYKRINNKGIKDVLIRFVKNDSKYTFSNLSPGEKIAYRIALWKFGLVKSNEQNVILLDEPDAFLNPSLIKHFFYTLNEYYIKVGTQIIIVTHNPILANLAPENSLFWMQDGRIIKKNKKNIINILADGLFTANDIQGIFKIFQKDYNVPNLVILCEGVDDEITLREWFPDGEKIAIIDCKSADNIAMFTKLPYSANHDKKPNILCLLDNDKKGRKVEKIIQSMIKNSGNCGNLIYILRVSNVEGDRMEEVLIDNSKVQNLKSNILKYL
ncbi:ATP-dependent nuclease [Candidatus Deianiraea vastatrix]|uniref:ABC transporter ATP-binding protein n=1 Tax=Candidatus Deianiraea vastatrix TaxID=2163644 RepID=A0A5B8XF05_9RICK|nr:AAA family ATPase [Candidatus Deianiraea vastatrix]QED23004.1 Putative ABC transporter ATP-binding protein [Candidatus Deianiraea vastatrix]